jgi:transposase
LAASAVSWAKAVPMKAATTRRLLLPAWARALRTANQSSDSRQFETLLDLSPDGDPRVVIADKGYDAKANRDVARRRGIVPIIPYRSNAKNPPKVFPKMLYRARARVEQFIGKLKRFRRVAMRCEKTARNYASFVALACVFILVKSVHTA